MREASLTQRLFICCLLLLSTSFLSTAVVVVLPLLLLMLLLLFFALISIDLSPALSISIYVSRSVCATAPAGIRSGIKRGKSDG
jgi:hypothetical protein